EQHGWKRLGDPASSVEPAALRARVARVDCNWVAGRECRGRVRSAAGNTPSAIAHRRAAGGRAGQGCCPCAKQRLCQSLRNGRAKRGDYRDLEERRERSAVPGGFLFSRAAGRKQSSAKSAKFSA